MWLTEIPTIGLEKFAYLQRVWKQEKIQSFEDFFRCDNQKDVVPTMEAMQKMVDSITTKVLICSNLDGLYLT